jgi:hypothetical protein
MLRAEAGRRGRPANQLAREILEQQLRVMQADCLDQEIEAYARAASQSSQDSALVDGAAGLWELLRSDDW